MIDRGNPSDLGTSVPVLDGEALVGALTRRFRTSVEDATVDEHTFSILKPANADDLIREEDFVKDERLPYWADVWPSSIILAGKLLELDGRGRSALELGCGVGLSTLAATSAGFDVLSTDYYEDALDVTRANVFRNLGKLARTRLVDWRHLPLDLGTFDLIFASDVLYEQEYAKLLPVLLRGLLSSEGIVLIADPGRVAAPVFVEACVEHGLAILKKETRPFEAGEIKQKIDIYEIGNT
jgi:predicted nicotinamide N-methyase